MKIRKSTTIEISLKLSEARALKRVMNHCRDDSVYKSFTEDDVKEIVSRLFFGLRDEAGGDT